MTIELQDEIYENILRWSSGLAIDALWLSVCKVMEGASYSDRKDFFLKVLYRILREGKARLASDDYLEGDVSEQVKLFQQAWPDESDIDDDLFWIKKDGEMWVPGGLVWLYEDGVEVWT